MKVIAPRVNTILCDYDRAAAVLTEGPLERLG